MKEDVKRNPDKFYSNSDSSINIEDFNDVSGSGFLSGLGDLIKDIIVKDKDLVIRIIEKILSFKLLKMNYWIHQKDVERIKIIAKRFYPFEICGLLGMFRKGGKFLLLLFFEQ